MSLKKLKLHLALLFSFFVSSHAFSFYEVAPNPDDIDIYLITVDVGSGIDKRYGHTILRISNQKTKKESLLNWGTFDFEDPMFAVNFLRGKLRYWVSESSLRRTLYRYGKWENRRTWQDKLNLTRQQKSKLLNILVEKLHPDKKYFWYDFFYRNCSTIPRDFLDDILHGRLKEATENKPAEMNLRTYVREGLNEWSSIAFFLDIMLNEEVDKPINQWVEMFHPLKLRESISRLPQISDEGTPIPGSQLISDSTVLIQGGHYPPSKINMFYICLYSGLVLFVLTLILRLLNHVKLSNRVLAIASFLWFSFSGFIGSVMLLGWLISKHSMLYHNVNLLLFLPFDFIFVRASYKALKTGFWQKGPWFRNLLFMHMALAIAFFFNGVFSIAPQAVDQVFYNLFPVHVGLLALLYTLRTDTD